LVTISLRSLSDTQIIGAKAVIVMIKLKMIAAVKNLQSLYSIEFLYIDAFIMKIN
jgi:hypothetical protein